jgi:alkanesulfonate monooxygenase
MPRLEFGWYLSTHGDTTAYGLPEAQGWARRNSADLLIPVGSTRRKACISGAFVAAHSAQTKPLIAARPILAANSRGRLAV